MRSALLCLLVMLVCAASASAQAPTGAAGAAAATPVATATQDDSSDDTADDPGDDTADGGGDDTSDPGDFTDDPLDGDNGDTGGCDSGDSDYDYCAYGCGGGGSGDAADYVYYCPSIAENAGTGVPNDIKRDKAAGGSGAGGKVEALPAAQLPYTGAGDHPAIIALIGLSFLMIGAGGRLRLKR